MVEVGRVLDVVFILNYTFFCCIVEMSRGRGRGRGVGRGNLEALGLSPGEAAPPPILQPPPLFPALDHKPLDLKSSAINDYLVSISHDLKQSMIQSPFHLRTTSNSLKMTRYSDRYREKGGDDKSIGWDIEWTHFPKELMPRRKKKRTGYSRTQFSPSSGRKRKRTLESIQDSSIKGAAVDCGVPKKFRCETTVEGSGDDSVKESTLPKKLRRVTFDDDITEDASELEKRLESLEKTEQHSGESEQSAEEENTEEIYDDEEEEEGTDYNLTYFDNGEDYDVGGGGEDALEEGPIY